MRIKYAAVVASLLFTFVLPLEAKIVGFPEDEPVFQFNLPKDWTMKADKDGDLVCKSGEHIGVTLNVNKMNQTFAQVKESLPELGKVFAKSAKLTEIETKDMGDDNNKNGVKGTIYVVKGKSSGRLLTAELLAVEPKQGGSAYFIMFSGLAEALQQHGTDISAIVDSIKPVE